MKKIFITMITIGFLLMPLMVYAQSNQMPAGTPPVAQSLVPEGDFALKLVTTLKLGTPESEAQAEDMLTSVGIAPRNGWIADYPVTPDIIGELQNAVVTAADSKKLPLGKDEALNAFQNLIAEFGLAVLPGSSGKYAESPPQPNPTVINNYYYEEGPPIVTYYPPPWDYYYLYAWVPYPFWCSGFIFPGFFVLHDFHRVIFVGHHRFVVTNHFINPKTHTVTTVDPMKRFSGTTSKTFTDTSHKGGFNSTEGKKGAASIFERSRGQVSSLNDRTTTMGSNSGRNLSTIGRQNEMNIQGGQGKSFKTPNVTNERSFNAPSMGNQGGSRSLGSSQSSGRSFSAPSRSFSAPSSGSSGSFHSDGGHSFGGSSGGGSIHGGFSGGHGGGCRGRC